jgi:hypothetical protein
MGGNVGIGTTAPVVKLEVAGQIKITGGTPAAGKVLTSDSTGLATWETAGGGGWTQTGTVVSLTTATNNVGIGTASPTFPLHMGSGAHVTAGGVWTNASSRAYKENISSLDIGEALKTLKGLEPVTYNYKGTDPEKYVGFIAEDVPALVSTEDRKGLSPMDIVAVLTQVVKQQQKEIEELKKMFSSSVIFPANPE